MFKNMTEKIVTPKATETAGSPLSRALTRTLEAARKIVKAAMAPIPEGTIPSDAAMGARGRYHLPRIAMTPRRADRDPSSDETGKLARPRRTSLTEADRELLTARRGLSDAAIGRRDEITRDQLR